MPIDPSIRDHQAWLGYLQPDGLVVSPAALVDAQVILNRDTLPLQQRFLPFTSELTFGDADPVPAITNFTTFVREFLEWPDDCLVGLSSDRPLPDSLQIDLKELGEILYPTFAFKDPQPKDPAQPWLLLVKCLLPGTSLDAVTTGDQAGWSASASRRFERLLRETRVPIGLLTNSTHIRLLYAPHGENAGTLTFPVSAMTEVAGRPILAALDMLLNRYRLLAAPSEARLPALLTRSRDYQSRVSTMLASQVMEGLYELLRGFQAADERANKELLQDLIAQRPNDIYAGLLTVLMRLVFLLFAEDRGLLPGTSLYQQNYSVHGLFERLRADNERYPDTMDQRYGAWAQLLALFRAIYDGCPHLQMKMPARRGYLFDPDRFPFLDGHAISSRRLPLVPDGVIFRMLAKLLILDGERLSYRTLDVEQIGSVYEMMMGFGIGVAKGPTVAIKPKKPLGAPVPINLEELLSVPGTERAKWLLANTDQELTGEAVNALKSADTILGLLAALERRIARNVTPAPIAQGGLVAVPSDERRRSGSNYTPRKLTEPIVRKALEPILKRLGEKPTPEQILDLKICDPAIGSGAFQVETCRQLAEVLVKSWHAHGRVHSIPLDEDELLYAKRIIAQRCLYGVDRNPMAADLAKLSLWLATLAKDHPFTFLDHAIRCGDSLVGLSLNQIKAFHWKPAAQTEFRTQTIDDRVTAVRTSRQEILEAGDFLPFDVKRAKLAKADEELNLVRFVGDLVIAAFFGAEKDRARQTLRDDYLAQLAEYLRTGNMQVRPGKYVDALHSGEHPVTPFHWEIEFPEVFARKNGGFDAFVGNPPFAGIVTLGAGSHEHYTDFLHAFYPASGGKADLVAFFFRRVFQLLRVGGSLGLVATKTIAQGDTRESGLLPIVQAGGAIYGAIRRLVWPGEAAVIVSVVHIAKGFSFPPKLDQQPVTRISAYLLAGNVDSSPQRLVKDKCGVIAGMGNKPNGKGFILADIAARDSLLSSDATSAEVVRPLLGGSDLNQAPVALPMRFIVDFGERSREEASTFPGALALVESAVKPFVSRSTWWLFEHRAQDVLDSVRRKQLRHVLVLAYTSDTLGFTFVDTSWCFGDSIIIFSSASHAIFAVLQSRVHEAWVRTFASTMKDDIRYVPGDCFDTFPFAETPEDNPALEAMGKAYFDFRADLMVRNNEGLTKTYNRFHDPEECGPGILKLRELHAAMDRAVLGAYGWTDISTDCQFLLDYEEEEDDDTSADAPARRRKKPWRYRWPDPIRDEVLARLLALNAQRAEEEKLAGPGAANGTKPTRRRPRTAKSSPSVPSATMFDKTAEDAK